MVPAKFTTPGALLYTSSMVVVALMVPLAMLSEELPAKVMSRPDNAPYVVKSAADSVTGPLNS